ncbi:MAG: asparagine synthase (glutamine-hydrolyzing), partial [Myxococcales bacterium]|nr:asparagine synthase (glutamine-hydrolyzing) [Myxococcales bacterium]
MCGIAGLVALDGDPASLSWSARDDLARMLHALAHRGPDGEGVAAAGPALFGHRRLAIIDVDGGAQPIRDAAGTVLLTFNGEIYNYRALRDNLGGRGHHFATRSDSEVLAAAVAEWGAGCLPLLRGMFAFAAWDTRRRRLLFARDRLGKKPFYWARVGATLAFASELPALLAWSEAPRALDAAAIADYLRHGYVAAPRTMVAGVHKLPAASYVEVTVDDRAQWAPRSWWRPAYEPKIRRGDPVAELDCLLDEAVADRLISEVPVGAFVSGGLDSASIVTRAARQRPGLHSFTVGFNDGAADERPAARLVARRAETTHHEALVTLDATALAPTVARHLGEPLADSSALPTYVVAGLARTRVKVVLTGDGGDELFAGYDRYARSRLSLSYALAPAPLRRVAAVALRALGVPRPRLDELEARARRSPGQVYADAMTVVDRHDAAALVAADHRVAALASLRDNYLERIHDDAPAHHWLDRLLHTDLCTYLAEGVLVKMDRMTMAHGVEA